MSSRKSPRLANSPLQTVFEDSQPEPRMSPLSRGTSYGETLSSTQTLLTQSLPRVKSLEHVVASRSHLSVDSVPGWRGSSISHDSSFEVDQVGDIRTVDSGWLDDDVEEVMVVKKKKRKPLSVIIEATEGLPRSPLKTTKLTSAVDASSFEYIRTLNVGETGESILARKTDTGKVHTVKLVRKSGYNAAGLAERITAEQKILRVSTECCVPFVASLFWSFEDERAMYLVMDRTDGRNLRTVVETQGPLPPHEAVLCAAELVEGISGLHALGIVHTSLKPESVLVGEDGHVFISDFDGSAFLHDDVERHLRPQVVPSVSSLGYQAPEILLGWEHDYAVDWWSFGLVLFWAATGNHPFVSISEMEHPAIVRSKVLHATLSGYRLGMEEDMYQLITRCLQRNPALRIDGPGARMHAYFHGISWEDIATKQIEAPFARHEHPVLQDLDEHEELEDNPVLVPTQSADSFAFNWQHLASPFGASVSSEISGTRGNLQALRNDYGLSDVTVKPQDFAKSSPALDSPAPDDGTPERQDSETLSGEFGTLPAGVSGASAKIGNLRRYSSLNFDLQSSASGMSLGAAAEELAGEPIPSPVQLRHARSFLGLSLGSTDDSLNAPSWTSKLRNRRTRADTPPLPIPVPAPELPKGVRQMGNGIGYTRRADVRRSVLTLASLTPRTCQAMFSGRLPRFGGKRKQKDAEALHDGARHEDVNGEDDAEDPMDEVMREIYGDDWAGGTSPDAPGTHAGPSRRSGNGVRDGGRVGLGWADPMARYGTPPVDASFAGADSTLRLVSPSTPRLGLY